MTAADRAAPAPVVDGRFGPRLDVPAEWRLLEDKELAAVWRTPRDVLVLVAFLPEAIVVDEKVLDDYRHDLRLVAAARGGGLLACDLDPKLGVVGLTKEPKPRGEGTSAIGRALLPCPQGHLAISVVAHEGDAPGPRDDGAAGKDPYGFVYETIDYDPLHGDQDDIERPAWPAKLRLAAPSDGPEHDAKHPDHPLSRVREVMAQLRERTTPAPWTPQPPPPVVQQDRVQVQLPPGFLAASEGRLAAGQLYRRVGFEKRVTFLVVARHPEAKDAGRSVQAAQKLIEQHLVASRALVRKGPRVTAATIGGADGVLVEHESRLGGAVAGGRGEGHPTWATTFLQPWMDHTLEVTAFGEADDWARMKRLVERVSSAVKSVARPALVPDTTRIVGEVTPAGRRRIYRILCHLAHCDGAVDPRERECLEGKRRELLISEDEAKALEAEGASGEKLDISKNPAEHKTLLDDMIDIVAADGCLGHEEQKRVLEIAVMAGIPKAQVTERLVERLSGGA